MQKLFLAICFTAVFAAMAQARVQEAMDITSLPEPQMQNATEQPKIREFTPDDFMSFLRDRVDTAVTEDEDKLKTGAIYVEPSEEAWKAHEEAQKTPFQKIYDAAMKRLDAEDKAAKRADLAAPKSFSSETYARQKQEWAQPDFPVIDVLLPPDNRRVTVPAREHIPYLMNNIEILPDGLLKFNETMVVVANGQKLRKGLTKVLPKYIVSRQKEKQKIDYAIMDVTVNGQAIPYKIIEQDTQVLLIPREDFNLQPGVYTYNFQYVADNALWNYQNFREFFWDITGSAWNLVIAKAGATLTLPTGIEPLGQQFFTGYPQMLNRDGINLLHETPATWGYAAKQPLFNGEGFYLIASLPENAVTPPTLTKRLLRLLDRKGDILISLLGFSAIWISFALSWKYIRSNKGQLKVTLKKSAVMLRYLANNRFDATSLAAFFLELYRRNIIDIQMADQTVLLIKRTDNTALLSKAERRALHQIFGSSEAVFNAGKSNLLKIKRAAGHLEKDLTAKLRRFILKLNSGYLFFSCGMLLLTELFISLLQVNSVQIWTVLSGASLAGGIGIMLMMLKTAHRWSSVLFKLGGISLLTAAFVMMAAVVNVATAVLLTASMIIIARYCTAYAQRSGLLKEHIKEAQKMRDYLMAHREGIVLGREIVNHQADIMALGLSAEFCEDNNRNEYNKLPAMQTMLKNLQDAARRR